MEPRNTVTRWVKARIDELVEEEMGSGTQLEQDDFKAAVEQFARRMETVQKDLDEQVKAKRANAAEKFETARLQSDMVFGLDDEPIPGIESGALGAAPGHPSSIALNANTRKRKRNNSSNGISIDAATILSETIERTTTVLAQALTSAPPEQAPTPAPALRPTTPPAKEADVAALEQKMTTMEARFEARMGDMQNMLSRILSAVGGQTESRKGINQN